MLILRTQVNLQVGDGNLAGKYIDDPRPPFTPTPCFKNVACFCALHEQTGVWSWLGSLDRPTISPLPPPQPRFTTKHETRWKDKIRLKLRVRLSDLSFTIPDVPHPPPAIQPRLTSKLKPCPKPSPEAEVLLKPRV